MKKEYRVYAKVGYICSTIVEARNIEEANLIARNIDGGEFAEVDGTGFWIVVPEDTELVSELCPRCIEDYTDDEGVQHKGTEVISDCPFCGVCKECEHLSECIDSK